VEEYSRIQECPDGWSICGPIKEQYKQIGNAVPIKLGEAIAKTILADMRGEMLPQVKGFPYSRYKNTSDCSWQAAFNKSLEKARAEQTPIESEFEQLSL
jgi:DNA (cytosine-5)-methyltransferase 1